MFYILNIFILLFVKQTMLFFNMNIKHRERERERERERCFLFTELLIIFYLQLFPLK